MSLITKRNFRKMIIVSYLYLNLILVLWAIIDIRLIEKYTGVQEFIGDTFLIIYIIFLLTFQYIFEIWISVIVSKLNVKTIFFPLGIVIFSITIAILNTFKVSYYLIETLSVLFYNFFLFFYYRFELNRINIYKRRILYDSSKNKLDWGNKIIKILAIFDLIFIIIISVPS